LIDRTLLAFHRRFDRAVAIVLDPAFQAEPARHARREKAVTDTLDLSVDTDVTLLSRHAGPILQSNACGACSCDGRRLFSPAPFLGSPERRPAGGSGGRRSRRSAASTPRSASPARPIRSAPRRDPPRASCAHCRRETKAPQ